VSEDEDAGSPDTLIADALLEEAAQKPLLAPHVSRPQGLAGGDWRRDETEDLVPPASSRQPRSKKDELPLDDGLPGILDPEADLMPESEERPPASRKVASVRGAEVGSVDDFSTWEIDGIAAEPPPTRKAAWLASTMDRKPQTEDVRVLIERPSPLGEAGVPDVVRKNLPASGAVTLSSAARSFRPSTFGELLDAALKLGED